MIGSWEPKLIPGYNNLSEGDIVAYVKEKRNTGYIKATKTYNNLIGICNDNAYYAYTPTETPLDPDTKQPIVFDNNFQKYQYTHILVMKQGETRIKFTGPSKIGGYVTISDMAGVGKLAEDKDDPIIAKILSDNSGITGLRYVYCEIIPNTMANVISDSNENKESVSEISDALNYMLLDDEFKSSTEVEEKIDEISEVLNNILFNTNLIESE